MQRKTKRRPDAFAAERRRAAPYTRPDKISASMFPLVRATHSNPLRSRCCCGIQNWKATAQLLAKDLVHYLCALDEGRPDLMAVDQLRGGRPVVPGQQCDALYSNAVGGQDR